jgi:hypothetical protein
MLFQAPWQQIVEEFVVVGLLTNSDTYLRKIRIRSNGIHWRFIGEAQIPPPPVPTRQENIPV